MEKRAWEEEIQKNGKQIQSCSPPKTFTFLSFPCTPDLDFSHTLLFIDRLHVIKAATWGEACLDHAWSEKQKNIPTSGSTSQNPTHPEILIPCKTMMI